MSVQPIPPFEDLSNKHDVYMLETVDRPIDSVEKKLDALRHGESVQLKSEFDGLSRWQAIKTFKVAAFICAICAFSAATDGYQSQLNGSIVSNKGFIKQMTHGGTALDATWVSSFGGVSSAGSVFGQFSIQFVTERFGRKMGMWTFLTGLLISVIVESVASEWWHWTLAKFFSGTSLGAVQATLPVYINEHAPSQIRGMLVVSYSMWSTLGGLMASIGLKVRSDKYPLDYKTPIYTQFAMIGGSAVIFWFLPESPWWLASKGKVDKARKVLEFKYGKVPGYDIERELGIIAASIESQKLWAEASRAEGYFAIFKGLGLKRFLIGSWPKVLQQFVGLSVFSNYSTYFFQIAGNSDPFLVTVYLGIVSLASVAFDAALVDKIGRRRMTLIGFSGACFGVTLMAIVGCFDYTKPSLASVLVFAGVCANFFNTFQSSTSYAYLTEMPEQRFRARATGWGLAYCNLYATLFSFTVPLMLKVWVVKTAFLFVGLGVPGTVLAFFIMPESSRRSPAEIHEMFVDHVPLRKWRGYKTQVETDLQARLEVRDLY